jgi:DNA-binding transcriptional ArsR family regulator
MILCHLVTVEKSVGQLEKLLDMSQSALSQHLAPCAVTSHEAQTTLATLYGLYCASDSKSDPENSEQTRT